MLKTKMLFGLAVVVSALAVMAVPAAAQWESTNNGQLKGPAHAGKGTFTGGGGTITCESAQGIWKIPGQAKTATSLKLRVHWNNCMVNGVVALAVSQCEFELKQPNKLEQKVVVSQLSPICTIKVPLFGANCEIIFKGQENQNLSTVTLSNSGLNQIDKFEIESIKDSVSGSGCGLAGITGTSTGTLSTEATLEGVNVV